MKKRIYITLSKKHLAVILALIIIALVLALQTISKKDNFIDGSTNELRVNFLKSIKLEPDDSNQTYKEIIIPQDFSEVYRKYNSLQKKAGFDLSSYKGKPATVYTYALSGTQKEIHLIVCNDKIIGGDIADIKADGELLPLQK